MKTMRRFMSIALLLVMIFTIAGCGQQNDAGGVKTFSAA